MLVRSSGGGLPKDALPSPLLLAAAAVAADAAAAAVTGAARRASSISASNSRFACDGEAEAEGHHAGSDMSLGRQAGRQAAALVGAWPTANQLAKPSLAFLRIKGLAHSTPHCRRQQSQTQKAPPATHLQLCQLEAPMQLVFAGSGGRGAGIMGRFLRGRKAGRHAYWQTWHGSMGWKLAT